MYRLMYNSDVRYVSNKDGFTITLDVSPMMRRSTIILIDCPMDVMDEIGGWSKQSNSQTYGEGYLLKAICTFIV
jgi:23S rRNA A2030 N6-methylase RlmJ